MIDFSADEDVVWKVENLRYIQECIKQQRRGKAMYTYNGKTYYTVSEPVGIEDWTLIGIVCSDAVDSGMRNMQKLTLIILGATAVFIILLVMIVLVSRTV